MNGWSFIWLVVEPYPSEKYELVSWDDDIPNCFWKVIQNSMVPVTTNHLWISNENLNENGIYPRKMGKNRRKSVHGIWGWLESHQKKNGDDLGMVQMAARVYHIIWIYMDLYGFVWIYIYGLVWVFFDISSLVLWITVYFGCLQMYDPVIRLFGGFHKWSYQSLDGLFHGKSQSKIWLVVSIPLKNMSSSVGMMTFPTVSGKSFKIPWFQSPPTRYINHWLSLLTIINHYY